MSNQSPLELFPADPGLIGCDAAGRAVTLAPMTLEAAGALGQAMAAIDPWARAGYSAERLCDFFARSEAATSRYCILADAALAGVMVVRHAWLHGPYLHFIGLRPEFHGQHIGDAALGWLEREARRGNSRNIWLCCSDYNTGARRFYEAHGFRITAEIDGLVFDGMSELLMRKQLV